MTHTNRLARRLLAVVAALTILAAAQQAQAARLGLFCPPPCASVPCAPEPCAPPPCCETKTVVVEVCHPCTCCKLQVELCVPACCEGCPLVRERCTLIGCGLVRYDWCCGYTAIIRFEKCGGYHVNYRG